MPTSSLELARRIERGEAVNIATRIDAMRAAEPASPAARLEVAGGQAGFCAHGSPLNDARGLGMEGPVSDADLDALEAFYRALGEPVTVHLSPYADPSLTTALGRRDYHLTDFEQVLVRGVERGSRRAAPVGRVRVERVARDEAASWSRVVAEGFGGAEALTDAGIAVGVTLFHAPDVTCFRAFVDGEPAGGAAVQCVSGLGVAYLFAASTLPAHRQRGVQAALLEARLAHAGESGCDLATVSTVPGTASQRNVERHGFRVAYTRVIVVRAAA